MKKFILVGVLSALLFPIVWRCIVGRRAFEAVFLNHYPFLTGCCFVVGVNAALCLHILLKFVLSYPREMRSTMLLYGGSLLAGFFLVMEGILYLVITGNELMALGSWLLYAEMPGAVATLLSHLLVAYLFGLDIPTAPPPPVSR